MDVKRASEVINEILECVTSVANSDATLYAKSKQRLQHLSQVCNTITQTVSNILHEESCTVNDSTNMQSELMSLKQDVEMLKSILTQSNCLNSDIAEQSDNTVNEVVSESNVTDSVQPVSISESSADITSSATVDMPKLSSTEMKQLVAQYGRVLKTAAVTDQQTLAANECAKIIWRWFDARIYTTYPNAPPFHYGAHRLKSMIHALVLTYSYHFEQGSVDVFLRYFEDWLISLSQSSDSNKWIAPYTVYSVERKLTPEYATLTAVIIWDILMSNGLQSLCSTNDPYMLHENDMWDLVSSVNINALDSYVNYKEDSTILESLNTSYNATTL